MVPPPYHCCFYKSLVSFILLLISHYRITYPGHRHQPIVDLYKKSLCGHRILGSIQLRICAASCPKIYRGNMIPSPVWFPRINIVYRHWPSRHSRWAMPKTPSGKCLSVITTCMGGTSTTYSWSGIWWAQPVSNRNNSKYRMLPPIIPFLLLR